LYAEPLDSLENSSESPESLESGWINPLIEDDLTGGETSDLLNMRQAIRTRLAKPTIHLNGRPIRLSNRSGNLRIRYLGLLGSATPGISAGHCRWLRTKRNGDNLTLEGAQLEVG